MEAPPSCLVHDRVVEDVPVVRLRGLPWDTTSQDVEKFLEGVNIGPEGVILTLDQRGRTFGTLLK
jgi:epithelial splicing regulatory protein 1/2